MKKVKFRVGRMICSIVIPKDADAAQEIKEMYPVFTIIKTEE